MAKFNGNIIIPMAGRGQRFLDEGHTLPKPLIDVNGETMIEVAIKSLDIQANYVFIIFKYTDYTLTERLKNILNNLTINPTIIEIDYITEGPAASALLAKEYVNNDSELIITNCDQIMNWISHCFIEYVNSRYEMDGMVVTYSSNTNKNSYIKLDENGYGIKLAEKEVISNDSLNGIHYWKKGKYFVESAENMINKNIRVNNEFYISTTYNELIQSGKKIGAYKLAEGKHIPVGVPEDLKKYKNGNI
jgi:NDP-sugar pyrophosphorylase family protein